MAVTVIMATGDTSAGTLISRSIIEHFGVQMFKQGLDCFPSLPGAVLLSHGGRRLGSWPHGYPSYRENIVHRQQSLRFLHFHPRCNMDFSCSRPFTCTLLGFRGSASAFVSLFIVTCECVWVCLLVLVGDLHLNLCIQSGCLATWLEFSPLMVDPICVWLAPWSDRMVVDFQCCWSVAEIQERHVQLWTYDLRET